MFNEIVFTVIGNIGTDTRKTVKINNYFIQATFLLINRRRTNLYLKLVLQEKHTEQ